MREIDCRSCAAVCCGPNIQLQLTDAERQFLADAGTRIEEVIPSLPIDVELIVKPKEKTVAALENSTVSHIKADHGVYILRSKCGHVVNQDGFQACGVYNDPRRPAVCGEFRVGGNACKAMRVSRGVDR